MSLYVSFPTVFSRHWPGNCKPFLNVYANVSSDASQARFKLHVSSATMKQEITMKQQTYYETGRSIKKAKDCVTFQRYRFGDRLQIISTCSYSA